MKDKRKFRINVILTLLVMAAIFVHSAMPADLSSRESGFFVYLAEKLFHMEAEDISFFIRKAAHFTQYLVLGIFMANTVRRGCICARVKQAGWLLSVGLPWIIGCAYAVTDEIHQRFVPGRSCEVRDMCIDAAGMLCGVLVLVIGNRGRQRRRR